MPDVGRDGSKTARGRSTGGPTTSRAIAIRANVCDTVGAAFPGQDSSGSHPVFTVQSTWRINFQIATCTILYNRQKNYQNVVCEAFVGAGIGVRRDGVSPLIPPVRDMSEETNEAVSRRTVLRTTGAAAAALTVGTTAASADESLPGRCQFIVNPKESRGDFSSINTAVTEAGKAANSDDGCGHGLVKVHGGTYVEQVAFDQPNVQVVPFGNGPVTIRFESDSGQPTVKVDSDNVALSGFTVERAPDSGRTDSSNFAQGIRIAASNVYVTHNVVRGELSDVQNKGVMVLDDGKELTNIAIRNNEVEGFEGGISTTLAYGGSIAGVNVENNAASNRTDGVNVATLVDGASPSDVEIVGNDVSSNAVGIRVYGADDGPGLTDADASAVTATENNVVGNEVGARNVGTGTLDATDCWWGHETGPERDNPVLGSVGEGDSVEGDVEFLPWALSSN